MTTDLDIYRSAHVPDAERRVTAFADPAGIGLSEFQHPQTHRLVANVYPSLREKILDIPIAHRETEIEPNGLSNDVGMEAVATV